MTADPELLAGTPYSLPEEADGAVAQMVTRVRKIRIGLRDALDTATRIGRLKEIDRAHAYWSVFESNRIALEGPHLSGTVNAIELKPGQQVLRSLNVSLLPEIQAGTMRLRRDRSGDGALSRHFGTSVAIATERHRPTSVRSTQ